MDGTVRNANGTIVGHVGPNGQVWDQRGCEVGLTNSNGTVWDRIMRDVGTIKTDSRHIRDKAGHIIGHLKEDGTVLNANGVSVGTVSDVPPILMGAAGLLLLLPPASS